MRLVSANPSQIAQYVAAGIPHIQAAGGFTDFQAIGIADSQNRLVGGIVVSHRNAFDAHISARLTRKNALTPRIIRTLLNFAFESMKLQRLTMLIAPDNLSAQRVAEKLKFQHEGVLRRGYDGTRDALVYGLTVDDWFQTWAVPHLHRQTHGIKRQHKAPQTVKRQ